MFSWKTLPKLVGKELSLCFNIPASKKDSINSLGKLTTSLPDILRNLLPPPPHTHKHPAHTCILQNPLCEGAFLGNQLETTGKHWFHTTLHQVPGPVLNWAFNPKLKLIVFGLHIWVSDGDGGRSLSEGREKRR